MQEYRELWYHIYSLRWLYKEFLQTIDVIVPVHFRYRFGYIGIAASQQLLCLRFEQKDTCHHTRLHRSVVDVGTVRVLQCQAGPSA
jgi:hypothetical protein